MKFDTRILLTTGLVTVVLLTGCATKRYPIATPLAPTEASLLSCRDIALELARADQSKNRSMKPARWIGALLQASWVT